MGNINQPGESEPSGSEVRKISVLKKVYPQIYSYMLPDEPANQGSQKIGYTERYSVDDRIYEQTHTPAKRLSFKKLWSAPAFFQSAKKDDFKDTDFHKFLRKEGIENRLDLGKEWFYFDGTPERSKQLFDLFRAKGPAALQIAHGAKTPYVLRKEQQDAVDRTLEYFATHENKDFLWNAKPRFGKTLASYDLAKRLDTRNVLVVTNRPSIANSWFDDFEKFVDDYYFISTTSSLTDRKTMSREEYNEIDDMNKSQITFLSLQDLKGAKYFGGNYEKLCWIADLNWDLLIIDEAHEGVDTDKTYAALTNVKRKYTLQLSGTPFKALTNNKFPDGAIYNWTYLDEQKEKQQEIEDGNESGDHVDLPDLTVYAYRISEMIKTEVNEGVDIDGEIRDYAFGLNEFFVTKNRKFVHEDDVKQFLHHLSTNEKYPFSTPELRDEFKHTFWYVGNRVDSVKALEQLLKQDEVFGNGNYKIVIAAGNGQSFDNEDDDFRANEQSFNKVQKAIKENPRTITLSCGQLTTGVTIKEWSAVLMLTDIKSPSLYMQAAFRAQNPYRFMENGEHKAKQSAYLFDFAPSRVLKMYDDFANSLNPAAVNGKITERERKENIKDLLNYFPVISEDANGEMVELDAEKVLTFPNAIAAADIVKARFMSNLLLNDNIKGVFNFPKKAEEILNKMSVEKNKWLEKPKSNLDIDDAHKVQQEKQHNVNENVGVILGQKIYGTNIDRIVDNAISLDTPDETIDAIPEETMALTEPLIAKYKETYQVSAKDIETTKKDLEEKAKLMVAEYQSAEIKDPEKLKKDLTSLIENDFVKNSVEQQETKVVESVEKTKEEEIRERLRSFTRTIPMFIMANTAKGEITIDNFDEAVSDADFVDLTNVTKEEFHKLCDGFDYTSDDGKNEHFGGVFDHYRFNASIAKFVDKKKESSNYFQNDNDIFKLIPNQKNNQIFTPKKVVKFMLDDLEKESPELFRRTDSTFIDLYMKSGMYITEIVKKLFKNTRSGYTSDENCIKHILENQVYGLAPTKILFDITQEFIFGFDDEHKIDKRNFVQYDLCPDAKVNTAPAKLAQLFRKGGKDMKFDAVVGNPPYQAALSDNKMSRSIYPDFVRSAKSVARIVSLIMPARWMSGESGPYRETQGFVDEMLDGSHIMSFSLYPNSNDLFEGVDIKGGVCYFVWNDDYQKDLVNYTLSENSKNTIDKVPFRVNDNIIIRFPQLTGIVQKISRNPSNGSMKTLVSSWNPFGFVSDLFVKNNEGVSRISENPVQKDDFKIVGLLKAKRVYRYIPNNELKKNRPIAESWKVLIPRANGSGVFGEVFSTPILGTPMLICTDTFLQVGKFNNAYETNSLLKYVKTKFFRAMVGIKKTAVFNYKDAFTFVPLQNFTANSDIDWSKPIPEIDQRLYKKYNLDKHEIDFIEEKVKPME